MQLFKTLYHNIKGHIFKISSSSIISIFLERKLNGITSKSSNGRIIAPLPYLSHHTFILRLITCPLYILKLFDGDQRLLSEGGLSLDHPRVSGLQLGNQRHIASHRSISPPRKTDSTTSLYVTIWLSPLSLSVTVTFTLLFISRNCKTCLYMYTCVCMCIYYI